jgi:cytochrome c-type biogenesis protein CcmH
MPVNSRFAKIRCAWLLLIALLAGAAAAIDLQPAFEDPELEAQYQTLIREVRCLVCQNQTIADSTAPLAADLRREIRELFAAGQSREEIVQFLVDRYGDFVLYRPPLQPTTWALWGAPIVLCAIGLLVFVRVVRSRLRQPLDDDAPYS